jgi:hypothetical protein
MTGEGTISTTAEAVEAAALPRAHAVHSDPESCAGKVALPAGVAGQPLEAKSAAQWAYERVILYIQNFEEQLDADQEVAMGFTGAEPGVLRIEGIGYFEPDIVTFYGTGTDGFKTQLIQHVSQLNVLLRALLKEPDRPEPMRIGFRLAADLEAEKTSSAGGSKPGAPEGSARRAGSTPPA